MLKANHYRKYDGEHYGVFCDVETGLWHIAALFWDSSLCERVDLYGMVTAPNVGTPLCHTCVEHMMKIRHAEQEQINLRRWERQHNLINQIQTAVGNRQTALGCRQNIVAIGIETDKYALLWQRWNAVYWQTMKELREAIK